MLKFIAEFGPLIAFFIGYKTGGMMDATLYMLVASLIGVVIMYIRDRKINHINLISTILLMITCSLTLFSGNSMFIKIKPTILYCVFSIIFLVTHFKWRPAIEFALGHAIQFKDQRSWYILNIRFMWFFLFMAATNEIIWRNFDENTWVNFKIFGALPITLVFVMTQIPFILKHKDANS